MRLKTKLKTKLKITITIILLILTTPSFTQELTIFPHTAEIPEYIEPFSKPNMLRYMDELGIKFPKLTMGQAIHESSNFRSGLFKNNHNLFGMRRAEHRRSTAIGTKSRYAVYSNWKKSVEDFYIMQQGILENHKSKKSYYDYVFRNYAKDPNYRRKLQKYIK